MNHELDRSLVNVALGKRAAQSSRSRVSTKEEATGATNGRKTGGFGFHTGPQPQAWWMLDLEEPHRVEYITIYNRQDAGAERASSIRIRGSADGHEWQTILTTELLCFGGVLEGGPLDLWLGGRQTIRYLRIESMHPATQLHLDEVEVWVDRPTQSATLLERIVEGRLTTGSAELHALHRGYRLHNADDDVMRSAGDLGGVGIEALELRRFGRFGNQVIQLINATQAALVSGAGTVYMGRVNPFGLEGTRRAHDLLYVAEVPSPRDQRVLEGTFFYTAELGQLVRGVATMRQALVERYLDPLFSEVLDALPRPDDATLHVHIRAGDLFSAHGVHPGYPQPPLSYYQRCIEHAQAAHRVRQVVLVYEDDTNPCVAGLRAWLEARKLPHRAQSSTFENDVRELLSARRMVASFGTFCDAITLLSRNIEAYYAFRTKRYATELQGKGATFVHVTESEPPGYIAVGSWQNTPSQQQEMLSYPGSSLRLDELP